MSWSVQATGFAAAIAPVIEEQFASHRCGAGAEESVRQSARSAIAFALHGCSPELVVKVAAQGHHTQYGADLVETFSVTFEPLYGFIKGPQGS